MDPPPPVDDGLGEKLQWVVTTVLGIIAFFFALWAKYIGDELKFLKEQQNAFSREANESRKTGDDGIWEVLESIRDRINHLVHKDELLRLQQSLEEDRRLAANDRANIAVMMATKAELERQLDKLYDRLMLQLQK